MKRIAVMILMISTLLSAEWIYRVSSPLMGELGVIRLDKKVQGKRYRITGEAQSRGIVKMLSGNRKEQYLSEGEVVNGRLRSEHFKIIRRTKKKKEIIDYRIDRNSHKITKRKIRWKHGKLDKNSTETLSYFTDDDLATLYFNSLPPKFGAGEEADLLAAGAEKIDGRVTIRVPDSATAARERKRLGVGSGTPMAYLLSKKKLLGKKNRKIVVAFDAAGNLQKAYLVAIPVVGEITVERVRGNP